MKKLALLFAAAAATVLSGCGIFKGDDSSLNSLQRGMTMDQVQAQCGKPHFRKFNADVTTWEYRTHSNQRVFLLDFVDGKLVSLDSYYEQFDSSDQPSATVVQGGNRGGYVTPVAPPSQVSRLNPPMDKREFDRFLATVKKQSFDDSKLEMITTGLRSTAVTSSQVVALMKLLSFSDAQLKLVRFADERIADERNLYLIVDAFTFDSDKREAAKILKIRY